MKRIVSLFSALALLLTLGVGSAEAAKKKKPADTAASGALTGTISKVSDDGKTITVTGTPAKKKQPAPTQDVKITDKTKIEYVGIDKDSQKLQSGYAVSVTLDDTNKDTATAITVSNAPAKTKKKKKKDPNP